MRPETLKLLHDVRQAAEDIAEFASGKSLDEFRADKQLRMAVERGFEIIGEAMSQLRKTEPEMLERISDWRAIIGFRNVLIHAYGVVDHGKTWDVLINELPVLRREIQLLLA